MVLLCHDLYPVAIIVFSINKRGESKLFSGTSLNLQNKTSTVKKFFGINLLILLIPTKEEEPPELYLRQS